MLTACGPISAPCSPTHYESLHPLAPKPKTYKLIGMLGAVICAYTLICTGYVAVGIGGYLAFPTKVASNVLNSFPADDVVMQVSPTL